MMPLCSRSALPPPVPATCTACNVSKVVAAAGVLAAIAANGVGAEMLWGASTAAYQVEGFRQADGRQPSVWDAFDTEGISQVIQATKPNGKPNVFHWDNGSVAVSEYVRYSQSAELHRQLGFGAARLSLAWPRLLSYSIDNDGQLRAARNERGIAHYREVLSAFRAKGLQIAVTLFHWDLPLVIEEFAASQPCASAWLCHEWFPALFEEYVALALNEFKDLGDWWITLNEPRTIVENGYATGTHAPGRCSNRSLCWAGNSYTEPYMAIKGMLLAHARAFRRWEREGRPGKGCGITLNADWRIPASWTPEDEAAATRSLELEVASFADPVHFGRWPVSMVERIGDRLPAWTAAEIALVNGSHDRHYFINSYTTLFVRAAKRDCGYFCDAGTEISGYDFATGQPIGTPSRNGWLFNYGPGLGSLVNWINSRYLGLAFVITETGWGSVPKSEAEELEVIDLERCNFYRDYIGNLSAIAARHDIDVKAYFAWSLFDNFEWADGYAVRFGLTYVDYATQSRVPKGSAEWFRRHVTPLRELPRDGLPFPPCTGKYSGGFLGHESGIGRIPETAVLSI